MHYLDFYTKSGFSFFNTGTNEKKVKVPWTQYQTAKPSIADIQKFLKYSTQNYALVCGEISDLVVIDVDIRNGGNPEPFLNRGFYTVKTPSGGYHFYFKYDEQLKSTKHKRTDNASDFLKGIDVQSNGSLVFAPPSIFPDKPPYEVINEAPIIPMPDDLLVQVLSALEPEAQAAKATTPFKPVPFPEKGRPGDIFNALATWEDILIPLGWTLVGRPHGQQKFWRRPGKRREGVSASTDYKEHGLFFAYSTNVDGVIPMKGYTKFSLYSALYHNNDYGKAAKALVMENYRKAITEIC
jgi:hypothetical protein